MSTESFDITQLLSGLSLDSRRAELILKGVEIQEQLKKLTPVLFTQGGDPACEAIVQGFTKRDPDHGPFIVVADHDTFQETTALLSRLSGKSLIVTQVSARSLISTPLSKGGPNPSTGGKDRRQRTGRPAKRLHASSRNFPTRASATM